MDISLDLFVEFCVNTSEICRTIRNTNSGEINLVTSKTIHNFNSARFIETYGWKQMLKANRIELFSELYQHLAKKYTPL